MRGASRALLRRPRTGPVSGSAEVRTMTAKNAEPVIRKIKALPMPDIHPAEVGSARPVFMDMDPANLVVEETYQRNLSERSVSLIRKIVGGWDWRRFKPPAVVLVDGLYHVIDGQHICIAAVTHPMIETIPVMVVEAPEMVDRALAFVGHNRDRITVTGLQLHTAMLAAGDEDAQTIELVCERAGVRLLRFPPAQYQPGDTMALASIRALVNRHGAQKARQALQVLAEAKLAPIPADFIKAVAEIMFAEAYAGQVKPADLATVIRSISGPAQIEARQLALAKKLPFWRALAIVIFQGRRRGHRSAA